MTSLATFYERMRFIRRFEETLLDLFALGKLVGTTHAYIGQEADAVALIEHLGPDDDTTSPITAATGTTSRAPATRSACSPRSWGRRRACAGARAAASTCAGHFYSNGVLGSIVPVATGIALAEKREGTGAVSTVFLGDGTLGEGVTYESLNIASLWQLPALRRREQPLCAVDAGRARARRIDRGARSRLRGRADELDTTDVEGSTGGGPCGRIRESGAPFFLVLNTYRFSPHSSRTTSATSPRSRSAARAIPARRRRAAGDASGRRSSSLRGAAGRTVDAADAAPAAAPGVAA